MKTTISTEIIINTTAEKVWKILTNFEQYPSWNPFIKSIEGGLKIGEKLNVKIQSHNSKPMTFKPTVLTCIPNKLLVWKGHFLMQGILDGEHSFEIVDNGNRSITFRQSEIFSGILVGLFKLENTKKGFILMNEALKELCEQ